jgi:hypothetical protein
MINAGWYKTFSQHQVNLWLAYGRNPGADVCDSVRIDIDANHTVSLTGHATCCGKADITQTKYGNSHYNSPI